MICTAGTVTAGYSYDPYGHVAATTGTGTADNLIGYTGAPQDPGSTLLHLGNRWYNPATANFTTQDTNSYLDNPANGNRYAYAGDDPANNIDPSGYGLIAGLIGIAAAVSFGLGIASAFVAPPLSPVFLAASIVIGEPTVVYGVVCGFDPSSCEG